VSSLGPFPLFFTFIHRWKLPILHHISVRGGKAPAGGGLQPWPLCFAAPANRPGTAIAKTRKINDLQLMGLVNHFFTADGSCFGSFYPVGRQSF
jgi:hypothetical protein